MKFGENSRSSADAGRAPSWEKRSRNPYILVLIIALLLSVVCLLSWGKDRAETRSRLAGQFTEQAEIALPQIAEDCASAFRQYGEKWQFFIEETELAALHNVDRDYLSGLPAALFTDENMRGAWIFLERDETRGKPPFAINSKRTGSESGQVYAQKVIQSEYYIAARKRNALRIRPLLRTEFDVNSLLFNSAYSRSSEVRERLMLLVDGPVTYEGSFAGIAGFEVELPNVGDIFFSSAYLSNMELFLIDPNGEVAVSSRGSFIGEHYRNIQVEGYPDALTAIALGVANGDKFDAFLTGRGSSLTFAAFVPVDIGDGGPPWFLAALEDMYLVSQAGKIQLILLFLIWIMALCGLLIIHGARKRSAARVETDKAVAVMQPEAAAFFKKYESHRKACYVLCAFFCLPAMFFLKKYEKSYLAALDVSDLEAAAKVLFKMKMATAVGVVVGALLVYINIMYD